jgi:serine/threonine protein kinase
MATRLKELENRTFGSWRLLTMVDAGGMGAIFQGQHTELCTRVAVKVLLSGEDAAPDAIVRFLNEAKIGANVVHPNIARTIDMFRDERGLGFIVMEWLEGESLARRLEKGPCELREAVGIFLSTCRGLAAAHRANIVHRDVKPGNIFLAHEHDEIVPKLIDFGIARLAASSSHTRTGMVMGSPPYMSPEQWKGAKFVTIQSDVFALGVVLYEMLTGQNPFGGETIPEISLKIMTRRLPRHPDVPPSLHEVLLCATAPDVAVRIPSVDELAAQVYASIEDLLAAPTLRSNSPAPNSPRADIPTPVTPPAQALLPGPPVVDEHGTRGAASTSRQAIGQYLRIAVPITVIVAIVSGLTDLGSSFSSWMEAVGDARMLMMTVVVTSLSAAASYAVMTPPAPVRATSRTRAAAGVALLLCTCWGALVAFIEVWAALYASRLELGWRGGVLRHDVFLRCIGQGGMWLAGLVAGAVATWARAATEGDDSGEPPQA